ncbi:endonuclease/exonuclease/phosphatase family protein [Prosthecobacter vanneervenii]|uniref:Endonuclease/exonuclease/phosphatase family metal-dependent hydrolase n=1 Tax=Prosthecobacter vanneervenii TaxID=48466 RepID=A0A7W7Y880_9BACT|nr:endonuclease/exonuclease/phosphatase family protein [Prosthecobacter vanneervenii]MBB5031050.1 endonuclease/exonuclease/phosphatase family metal-dependent hydrolase [Prosthecobacter vanneervenii]
MLPLLPSTRRVFGLAVFFALAAISLPVPLGAAEEAPRQITFCSYNLKNWLSLEESVGQRPYHKPEAERERVVQTLAAIHPDILGVCEIGTADDLAELQQRLEKAGLELPYTELAHGGDETRRLALLSRLPIKARNSQTALTYQIGAQTLPMQRGILDVTISLTPTFDLHLLGVHLKSMRTTEEADQALMRRNEARLLRLHLDTLFAQDPKARILAYGDFNCQRNDPALAEVMGGLRTADTAMTDLLLRDPAGEVWTHFWDEADVYSRLDYCLTSRLLRPFIDTRSSGIHAEPDFIKASDHRPLVLKINTEPVRKGRR